MTEILSLEESEKLLKRSDSHNRLRDLCEIHRQMHFDDWVKVLGSEWSGFDSIHHAEKFLKFALGTNTQRLMMSRWEWKVYASLPSRVTIYRGCDRDLNTQGICWSLDRGIAANFTSYNRHSARNPVLVTASVLRSRIVAIKLDRGEREVITFSAKAVSTEAVGVFVI